MPCARLTETNGLLRQYWPKGSDLRALTQAECDDVAHG